MSAYKTPIAVDLPERLMLLATDDESGRVDSKSGALDLGLAGGALTELILMERLTIPDSIITVADASPTGDTILDGALATAAAARPRDPKHWVKALAKTHLREQTLASLTEKGILRREEHRLLWMLPADRYPAETDAPERDTREALRAAIVDGEEPTPRTAALVGVLVACDLIGAVFSRDERARHGDRIAAIAEAETLGPAVAKAVKETRDAVRIAAMTAAIAGATAASG